MQASLEPTIFETDTRSPHLPTVAKWLSDAWGLSQGYDYSGTLAWCGQLAGAADEALFVATKNDRLVGTVAVVACDLEGYEALEPWLASLYVARAERGQSIGESLVDAACDWARRRGYANLHLYACKGRLTQYYGRLGWRRMKEIDVDAATFEIMQKPLRGAGRNA